MENKKERFRDFLPSVDLKKYPLTGLRPHDSAVIVTVLHLYIAFV
jgi:hypothetical protein